MRAPKEDNTMNTRNMTRPFCLAIALGAGSIPANAGVIASCGLTEGYDYYPGDELIGVEPKWVQGNWKLTVVFMGTDKVEDVILTGKDANGEDWDAKRKRLQRYRGRSRQNWLRSPCLDPVGSGDRDIRFRHGEEEFLHVDSEIRTVQGDARCRRKVRIEIGVGARGGACRVGAGAMRRLQHGCADGGPSQPG